MNVIESETTVEIPYGQKPKWSNNGSLGAKFRIGMCQTTIPMSGSTLQM